MSKDKSNRTRLISMIHAQKNTAKLDEDCYRTIIFGATGKQSCTDCDMTELRAVFYDLNIVLERQGKQAFRFFAKNEHPTQLDAVKVRAKKILGTDWQARLDQFIQTKVRNTTLPCLTQKELRQVMGFLSTLERTAKK